VKTIETYAVEDFMCDDHFIKWVYSPDPLSSAYWEEIIRKYPSKKGEIEHAKNLLLAIQVKPVAIDENALNQLHGRILRNIDGPIIQESFRMEEKLLNDDDTSSFKYWKIAAVITGLVAVSFFILNLNPKNENNINSGTAKVTHEYSMTHLEEQVIPKGRRSMLQLADGTIVWLNADTRIEYAKDFTNRPTRDVYLKGEAYFEVAQDKEHPFIVHTEKVAIKVLGTSFNVKAYEMDPNIETTLIEGKVLIEQADKKGNINLIPNQRAVFNKKKQKIAIETTAITESYTSWKNGVLSFDDQPFSEIKPVLERWFNVRIHIENAESLDCRFTAKVNNKSLEEVLDLFKASDTISYRIEGREVYITGTFCN
jgi:transmembrane sensor